VTRPAPAADRSPGGPGGAGRRLSRRLAQLYIGLALYGASLALLVRAELGAAPWDVLHQGLARQTGLSIGTWVALAGVLVLLLWVPLRQRPGLGTVSNALGVGVALDATLALLPPLPAGAPLAAHVLVLGAGVALNGLATALYIGARLGPGPRDGLMTELAARGHSVRLVRSVIEVSVLTTGWLLGGTRASGRSSTRSASARSPRRCCRGSRCRSLCEPRRGLPGRAGASAQAPGLDRTASDSTASERCWHDATE
jgi:uncharacterized membrane protein YczE